jgi:predicted PurR-regulated permease PerM
MSGDPSGPPVGVRFRKGFVLAFALAITWLFLEMIGGFIRTLLVAGILSGLAQPMYRWLVRRFGGRQGLASAATVMIILFLIIGPVTGFLGVVAQEAFDVSRTVGPWIAQQVGTEGAVRVWLEGLPFADTIQQYQSQIAEKIGELAGRIGDFLVNSIAAATSRTVLFIFHLFIMLYAMYFFLIGGGDALERWLYYLPLAQEDKERLLGKFVSVARAMAKGTLVIGIIQGTLGGAAFALAGIPSSIFWGTIMMVLSIIPGIGTALVWIPAVVYLFAVGKVSAAIILTIWFAAVVGSVDNILRPILVGKDTKMPDLLVLLGTLGGLSLFGAVGLFIGPIIAAIFVVAWEIYGAAFSDVLGPRPAMAGVVTEPVSATEHFKGGDAQGGAVEPTLERPASRDSGDN